VSESGPAPTAHEADRTSASLNLAEWIRASRYVIAWLIPAFLCVLVKLLTLANGKGFRVVARYLGRVEGLGSTGLSINERLTFFRGELFWLFFVAPLMLLLILRFLPRVLRVAIPAVLGVATLLVVFVQARSLEEMGEFVSYPMLRTALIWGIHDPGANKSYLMTREFYLLLLSFAAMAAILIWAARRDRPNDSQRVRPRIWGAAALVYFGGVIILTGFAWRPLIPTTPYHENILLKSATALRAKDSVDTREFEGLSSDRLLARYREMTGAPVPVNDTRYFGAMRGANVIVFVLETEPARFLPADDPLDQFPTLRRLQPNSIIAAQHFTTYPYTNPALFSVFASCYPSDGTHSFGEEHPDAKIPGLASTLAYAGYATSMYLPNQLHGDADSMTFRAFGFSRNVFPDATAIRENWPAGVHPDWKADRIARDRAVLGIAKADIDRWLTANQPFAIAIAPQIGHLPWPDNEPDDTTTSIAARGRAVLSIQDAWLGELVALLSQHHALENTLIVVFGDHGIRTRREDPNFVGGTIDDYSFHVPLRIYAARATANPILIPWLTSHIDVTPTILDLLGVERSRMLEQGDAIWDPELAQRSSFFFARQAFGTDGYYSPPQFFMWNQISNAVSVSGRPHFEVSDVAPRDAAIQYEVIERIRRMVSFEQVWMERLSAIKPAANEQH
jgi:arylsulfatase A-like enzyme